jgi:ABC-2 type transport system ATP-binding protein
MDEAKLCERIALIQNGRIMSVDTPTNIIKGYPGKLFAAKSDNIYKLLKDFRAHPEIDSCYAFGEYIHITLKDPSSSGQDVLKRIAMENNHANVHIKEIEPGIEDSFILLMSQQKSLVQPRTAK